MAAKKSARSKAAAARARSQQRDKLKRRIERLLGEEFETYGEAKRALDEAQEETNEIDSLAEWERRYEKAQRAHEYLETEEYDGGADYPEG